MDRTCSILGIGYNWKYKNPNLINQLKHEIQKLVSNENVLLFLIEQAFCRSPAVKIINGIKKRNMQVKVNLVVQYPSNHTLDVNVFNNRYDFEFDGFVEFDPQAKILRARNLRTYKWMIDQADYLLCHLTEDSSANQSILKHARRKKALQVINLVPQ